VRLVSDNGLVAVIQDPLSSFLWKVTPDSFDVKLIVALVEETFPEGADVIVVVGAAVSITYVQGEEYTLVLFAPSTAITRQ
jgi:hypothetical protein